LIRSGKSKAGHRVRTRRARRLSGQKQYVSRSDPRAGTLVSVLDLDNAAVPDRPRKAPGDAPSRGDASDADVSLFTMSIVRSGDRRAPRRGDADRPIGRANARRCA